MLKKRVLPTLLFKDFGLVKGVAFDSWRRIGSALQSIKVYNMRNVDELVFLDITATNEGRGPDFALIDDLADECFMPLTVGGGVRELDDVRQLLRAGADKVAMNTAAVEQPELIEQAARRFGVQCVVVSIDARKSEHGYEVFTHSGTKATGVTPVDAARNAETLGAGEIIITSIERDGTLSGYDLELIASVTGAVDIPVVASGGAGTYDHLARAILEADASAVAASSMFQFTEQTPQEAKNYLDAQGIPVRL
ncbi:MAG: imidazole glycerol-phosphate synthase subunit HisF [Actinomycetota bacterium]|jgi:cyclase|nr:imidazole glycerol-phosphate synthase subunit HisF [Actinomycetota bacterium]